MKQKNDQIVLGYTVVNREKWVRAIDGTVGANGQLHGGVGEHASDAEKLAEYDRLGGLVRKGSHKVKTGSFYDFEKKEVRKKPEVMLVFRDLDGLEVEIAEGESVPVEVQAAEKIADKKRGVAKKAAGKKAKDADEESDESDESEGEEGEEDADA